jgi:hypothetical protein
MRREDGSAGATLPHFGPRSAEADRIARRTSTAHTVQEMVLSDLLAQSADNSSPAAETLRQLQALIAGASPDEVKALRRTLFKRDEPADAGIDPDTELSPGWREGAYPYKNLLSRKGYNRSGVERVMGFCTDGEYEEFLRQTPEFERQLVRSGVHLFKFWFSVSRSEQRRRFKERQAHPLKQWKLSPIDMASLDKWDEYTRAKEAMFVHCDTSDAPWTVIKSDCKKRARLNALRYLLHRLHYAKKDPSTIGAVDPLIVGRPSLVPSVGEDQLASTGG